MPVSSSNARAGRPPPRRGRANALHTALVSLTLGSLLSEHILEPENAMAIRVVRLGAPRIKGEGLRLGTVRRPPRGVPKSEFASRNFYDVWLPDLAPSEGLVKEAQPANDDRAWRSFEKKYRSEMKCPEAARLLGLLAALSQDTALSVGCYCENEAHCHRSVLRSLLRESGAKLAGPTS